jgi:acyl-CoA thioesterase-1
LEQELARDFILIVLLLVVSFGCSGKKPDKKGAVREVPSSLPEQDMRPVIVAFGDSLTAGQGVHPDMNYPAKLQAKVDAAGYSYRVVNAGVSGDTSSQGLNRLQSVLAMRPAIVIVEFGANDGLRGIPVEATSQNLAAIVSRLQSAGAEVVLAGMQIPPNYGPQYTGAFRSIFPTVAKRYNAALIPFFLEGVGGRLELNQDDGIHPTAEGYDVVTENVWKMLKPLL